MMKASRGTRSSLRSTTSASSVGGQVKRTYARRHSNSKNSSFASFHDSVASLRSGYTTLSASQSKASRHRSVVSDDTHSIGSYKSKASAASAKSPRRSSSSSVSSRRSSRSTPSFQEQLELVAERSQRSDWSGSGERSSPRSVASHVSNHSRRSRRSSRKSSLSNSHRSLVSANSRKSANSRQSNSHRSLVSVNSRKSASSRKSSNNSNWGEKESSLQQKGRTQLESKRFSEAIKSFTSALRACESPQDWSGSDDEATNGANGTMALLHRYRCEALYEIGLYELAARDARKSLKFEQSALNSDQLMTTLLPTDKGLALRGKLLSLLGYSLLRIGNNLESAKKSFDDSIELTKQAIDNLTDNDQPSTSLDNAKKLLKTTLDESKTGLNKIDNYNALVEKLKDSARKGYIKDLDSILDIAPDNTDLHVLKITHLINRKRWFVVANHCEQMAVKASRYCGVGIFKGDLLDENPFPDTKLEELDPEYFTRNDIVPHHLRILHAAASLEAAFLLSKEILPYYVTSLRLEDRYDSALLIGTALRTASKSVDNIEQELQKLNKTIKLRGEGNVFFRNGEFDRAASLYKQCLQVCSETKSGGKINAVLHYKLGQCFYAMSKYQDASTEFTHAISIHSMYSDAILQRARCHVQMKDMKKASANFNRYLTLVEGAKELPYPPPHKGSDCFFDMPGDVTYRKVESVKEEMKKHRFAINSNQDHNHTQSDLSSFIQKLNATFTELCCKKDVTNQVVVSKQQKDRGGPLRENDSNIRSSFSSRTSGTRRVSFLGDPPSHAPTVRSVRGGALTVFQSEFNTKDGIEP